MNKKLYWSLLVPVAISPIAIIASCSTNDASQKSDIELATQRITESLENYHINLREFKKPSEIKVDQIKTEMMMPSLNLGFTTKLKKITHNDATGELSLKVNLTRAMDENKEFEIKLNGFLTEAQEKANQEIQPREYFNGVGPNYLDITLVTKKPNELIPKKLTKELISEYIDLNSSGNPRSTLFKKPLPTDIKLEISNIKQAYLFGVEQAIIQADLNLVKGDLKTGTFVLFISGFTAHELFLNQDVDYLIQSFDTFGKLMIDPNNPNPNGNYYIDKKASAVQDVEEIKKYLKNNTSGNQLFEISEIVQNSANDREGSIMVKFKFKNIINQSTKEKEIKLYGFKPVNN